MIKRARVLIVNHQVKEEQQMRTKNETAMAQIDNIMDWFDFGKVQRVMKVLEWQWASSEEEGGVPCEGEIRSGARQRLIEALHGMSGSSGGFTARMTTGVEEGEPWVNMSLTFELEGWDSDGEVYNGEDS
jgi:hypothetical protein